MLTNVQCNISVDLYCHESVCHLHFLCRDPRELSADILCAFNFTFVDNVFDTGTYSYYDRNVSTKCRIV